jgi:hypothetical protein
MTSNMSIGLYEAIIPVMITGFKNLTSCLKRGQSYADVAGIPHAVLLQARLYEDMMTLTGQVQRASDTAKRAAVGLGGVDNVVMEDNEATFQQLHARIQRTVSVLQMVDPLQVERHRDDPIDLPLLSGRGSVSRKTYVFEFVLPNFFFHTTTAYDLLRNQGVPIGKRNYLGWE